MADQTPLRAIFDDSGKVTGLGQYQLSDTIGVVDGGTGTTTLTIGNIIIGNVGFNLSFSKLGIIIC